MIPLERAARALEAELRHQHEHSCLSHFLPRDAGEDWITVDGNIDITPVLRAVIAAIREPSEGFLTRIAPKTDGHNARVLWQHMIDQLLAEGEQ